MSLELDELEEIRADAQDVTGLKRQVQQLIRQNRRLKERVKELDAGKTADTRPPGEMTPRERFLENAGNRLAGLHGAAREAELGKIKSELEPLVEAELEEIRRNGAKRVEALRSTLQRLTRENAATEIIARIRRPGISADLLMPTVLARLEAQEHEGNFTAVGKGASGEPISLDALAEELRATPALAPFIAGTTAEEKAAHAARVRETLGQK